MLNHFTTMLSPRDSKFDVQPSELNIFHWSNVLAVDAALIALCWQSTFALFSSHALTPVSACVLGLSVWLTYAADRLFDVKKRSLAQLHSIRHRFTKRHAKTLWKFWFGAFFVNISIAFAGLKIHQLRNGAVLLIVCLLYTALNQKLSSRFFPKELCVAIIYAGGVIVFLLPAQNLWLPAGFLMLLCLINCLIISNNERQIDAAMEVHSIAQFLPKLPFALYLCCILMLGILQRQWLLPFGASLAGLMLVHVCQKRFSIETFRIVVDNALLIGPMLTLLFVFAQKNL